MILAPVALVIFVVLLALVVALATFVAFPALVVPTLLLLGMFPGLCSVPVLVVHTAVSVARAEMDLVARTALEPVARTATDFAVLAASPFVLMVSSFARNVFDLLTTWTLLDFRFAVQCLSFLSFLFPPLGFLQGLCFALFGRSLQNLLFDASHT